MARQLPGMIVAITGASAGIGKTLAEQLAARGAKLGLCARRVDKLEGLNAALGGGHYIARADVANPADCEAFVAGALARFGRLDTVVCNAGYGLYKLAADFTGDELRQMFATNVFGTADVIRAAVPAMRKQDLRDGWRGQIMIVSSAAGRRGVPYLGPYSATKAAQLSIAEALRVELRLDRIAVTSVHPIMTSTEFGQVAEASTGVKLPRETGPTQTVEHVARRMIAAIETPRPEVWPHRPSRVALALAGLFPGVADKAMGQFFRRVRALNDARS